MPWYIPLVSAVVGALVGFFGAYKLSKINFDRQVASDAKALSIAIECEIRLIISMLQGACESSSANYYVLLRKEFDATSFAHVYKANCGKFGLLRGESVDGIMKFYMKFFSMNPIQNKSPSDDSLCFEKNEVELCINIGRSASAMLVNDLRESK